jgi:hypothetical protein
MSRTFGARETTTPAPPSSATDGAASSPEPTTEERRIRAAVITWARARWPGCRVLHELVLGERRIDLVFVLERDIIGMEIKSSVDTLARFREQMKEYRRYLPEVHACVALKWRGAAELDRERNLLTITSEGAIHQERPSGGFKPERDELVCSRLLELLWRDEAAAIAVRTDVIPLRVPKQINRGKILKMLARLLTGNEIIEEVCRELRARQLVGLRSDNPLRAGQVGQNSSIAGH